MATRIRLDNVRIAFPHIFEPQESDEGGSPSYSAAFILPPDHPQLDAVRAAMKEAAKSFKKWDGKAEAMYKQVEASGKLALHDGNSKADLSGYAGNMFVNSRARETEPPKVLNRDRTPLTAREGRIYSGCYVNAVLQFWVQDNTYGKRINAQLCGVQFEADGDAFGGGRPASEDEFEASGGDASDFA